MIVVTRALGRNNEFSNAPETICMPNVVSHGVNIYYEAHGDGSKAPLLFCNGYGPPLDFVVKFYMPSFLDRCYCVVFDIRGIGGSGEPAEDAEFSLLRLAQDGLAVMDDLGLQTANVWGVSIGSVIAARLAALAPQRVRSLLLNSFDPLGLCIRQKKYAQTVRNRYAYMREPLEKGLSAEQAAEKMIAFYGPADSPRGRELVAYFASFLSSRSKPLRNWSLVTGAFPLASDIEEYIAKLPDTAESTAAERAMLFDLLHEIRAPTLIMSGQDPLIHRDFPLCGFERIPNAEFRLSKASRHSFSLAPGVLSDQADWIAKRNAEWAAAQNAQR